MGITKEALEARLEALERDLQTLQHNYYAIKGAIQDCQYWLKIVQEEDKNGSA